MVIAETQMETDGFGAVIWTELKSLADEGVVIMSSNDEVQHSLRLGTESVKFEVRRLESPWSWAKGTGRGVRVKEV